MSGTDGMERDLPLPGPVEEELYTLDGSSHRRLLIAPLPSTLGEALAALQADEVMLGALGATIAEWFVEAKTRKWDEYRNLLHPWELARYLPPY